MTYKNTINWTNIRLGLSRWRGKIKENNVRPELILLTERYSLISLYIIKVNTKITPDFPKFKVKVTRHNRKSLSVA